MKNVEFCRKTSKFLLKRCLFVFCIFYLNEKELNQQVCLIKWVVLVHDTRSKDLRSNDA